MHSLTGAQKLTLGRHFSPTTYNSSHWFFGEANLPSNIEGRLVHLSQFTEHQQNGEGKKAVVVGYCTSDHDIAQDYYEHEYDVIMVQRSSMLVIRSQTLMNVMIKEIYSGNGVKIFSRPTYTSHDGSRG
jgi:hypothetical protein